eukprot:CAMPEP_0198131792 /NCGR_PEP_ID=MMETSP1442-20131203/56934_1 /TAXON_ID= /ORGANISM="Craspedostauros australis, Strain CCMP3328" /LENGTH=153 /DNA_ID=CAMNT_0043792665 /DNA_START=158 /DNA_END=619 /DNA_ORIENTATION=+
MCEFDEDHTMNFWGERRTRIRIDHVTFDQHVDVMCHLEDTLIDQTYYHNYKPERMPVSILSKPTMPSSSSSSTVSTASTTSEDNPSAPQVHQKKQRRFSDEIEVFVIPEMDVESIDDLFYSEDEISNFRHEAFLEKCGLSLEEFSDLPSEESD